MVRLRRLLGASKRAKARLRAWCDRLKPFRCRSVGCCGSTTPNCCKWCPISICRFPISWPTQKVESDCSVLLTSILMYVYVVKDRGFSIYDRLRLIPKTAELEVLVEKTMREWKSHDILRHCAVATSVLLDRTQQSYFLFLPNRPWDAVSRVRSYSWPEDFCRLCQLWTLRYSCCFELASREVFAPLVTRFCHNSLDVRNFRNL